MTTMTDQASSALNKAMDKSQAMLDQTFPPEQRQQAQSFIVENPKLSAFIAINVALSGIPLGLFITFVLATIAFSILASIAFILTTIGFALLFLLPTILFTTSAACCIYLWGLGMWYILQWASQKGQSTESHGTSNGKSMGSMNGTEDKLSAKQLQKLQGHDS